MNIPCLLALDTSTDQLCVALLTPGGARCRVEPGGPQASARLIPALMQLLADAGATLAGLQAIAYGQGPGAFTGLRTACAVTQGLALAHDTPVLAIDSLLIVAEDARTQAAAGVAPDVAPEPASTQDWWVAMDARMDEVYAAAYRHGPQGWQTRVAPRLWTLPALSALWQDTPPQHLAGSAIAAFAGRLPWGSATLWPQSQDRAAALLRLAQAAWAQGRSLPADQALPLYLRDKVAFTSAERLAMAMAKPLGAQDHPPAPGLADTAGVPRATVGP
jgi:tRNA threonylcarbamoyladenosine biosynthesis protein TsaB